MSAHRKKININLLLLDSNDFSFSGQLLSWAFTYGRYIIIITQIIVLSVFFARFKLDRDHTDLKEAVTQKQAILESVTDLETEIHKVQKRLTDIKNIAENQNIIINILHFLQENTPTDTLFSSLSISSKKIVFNASARNLRSFSFLLSKLQQSDKFSEVTLEDILRRANGRVEFKINAKINTNSFSKQ